MLLNIKELAHGRVPGSLENMALRRQSPFVFDDDDSRKTGRGIHSKRLPEKSRLQRTCARKLSRN
jgi:hypothetical protein